MSLENLKLRQPDRRRRENRREMLSVYECKRRFASFLCELFATQLHYRRSASMFGLYSL
jgi:hypothetical protein